MKKLNKKDYLNLLIICLPALIFLLVIFASGNIFGSNVDWISQHYSIPEYFRTLFYEEGNLFPAFSKNLGLGQNIFYFSYYGLFSPIILISYLLPFIPMYIFIQIVTITMYFISIYLMYIWLKNKYSEKVAFTSTFIFALSGPLFFHAHRHFMFVIYFPFLIKTLMLIDEYLIGNKKVFLIILNVLAMILTSYYYSMSGIVVIGIYTIYKILESNKKIKISSFKPLLKIILMVSLSILMASLLLLPTVYTLLNGRLESNVEINIINLIFSKLKFNLTFYHAYSFGLTFIYVFSLMYVYLKKKKENIFLGIILLMCMILPIISYILNGFMYIDGKVFIPFLPLAIILIANFVDDLFIRKIEVKKLFIMMLPITIFMVYSAFGYINFHLLILDILVMLIVFYNIYKRKIGICSLIFLAPLITFFSLNFSDSYVKTNQIKNLNEPSIKYLLNNIDSNYRVGITDNVLENVNKIIDYKQNSSTIYASSAKKYYGNLIREIFNNEIINKDKATYTQTDNILFNLYTGTKYLITSNKEYLGYNQVLTKDGVKLLESNYSLPIIYYTNKTMSNTEFSELTYPYNIDALLNYIIIPDDKVNVYESLVEEIDLKTEIISKENIEYEQTDQGILIKAKNNNHLKLKINNDLTNKILIIKFRMGKEKKGYGCSSDITINNITNSLSCNTWKYHNNNYTFEYVLGNNQPLNELNIKFSKDSFLIKDIKTYTYDYNNIKNINKNIIPVKLINTKSNEYKGVINTNESGYIKTTIPYEEKGFTLKINGKEENIIIVDQTFIGFKVKEGINNISLVFDPPLYKEGKMLSLLGLGIFMMFFVKKKIFK